LTSYPASLRASRRSCSVVPPLLPQPPPPPPDVVVVVSAAGRRRPMPDTKSRLFSFLAAACTEIHSYLRYSS
jgi:hypothetical protein